MDKEKMSSARAEEIIEKVTEVAMNGLKDLGLLVEGAKDGDDITITKERIAVTRKEFGVGFRQVIVRQFDIVETK